MPPGPARRLNDFRTPYVGGSEYAPAPGPSAAGARAWATGCVSGRLSPHQLAFLRMDGRGARAPVG